MDLIQQACGNLAGHRDSFVQRSAAVIANADLARDNEVVKLLAWRSTAEAQIKTLRAACKRKDARIDKLMRMHFGPSSEQGVEGEDDEPADGERGDRSDCVDNEQDKDDKPDSEDDVQAEGPKSKPRGLRGKQKVSNPAHLRREKKTIEPDPSQFCSCKNCRVQMGEQVIERLGYKPAEIYVIEERYPQYTCRDCNRLVQARTPDRVSDYSRFDTSLIVGILIAKYGDFLPLFRLQQIFGRSGVKLNRGTLSRLIKRASDILRPVYEALIADLKSGSKLFMDETTVPLLVPGLGKTKTCYAWAMCRDDRRWNGNLPPAVAFHFALSRGGEHAENFLTGFHGILQVDAYGAYNRLTRSDRPGGALTLAYCWAHVRRGFRDISNSTKSDAARKIQKMIGQLYGIEKRLKGQPTLVRQSVRAAESAPIVDELFQYLELLSTQVMMNSSLGEAVNYTLKLRAGLRIFLSDGRVEIDSNAVENTIRPLALLRKNALFAGSEFGGEAWAIMCSLIGTCKLNGVEPHAYMTWVFEQVAAKLPRSQYNKLLPWNCPKGRHSD